MDNEKITELREQVENNMIKTVVEQVLNDLLKEMPTSNRWHWFYAFDTVAHKYGVEIKK